MNDPYRFFAQFYDAYVGAFQADWPFYLALCAGRAQVLEIGCGTGRVLQPLLAAGHTVTGVDLSDEMLAQARKKLAAALAQGRLRLARHDFQQAPLAPPFDAALVTFYTFNYLLTDAAQQAFLQNVWASLAPGAPIALDLFYPAPLAHPETAGQWQQSEYLLENRPVALRQTRQMHGQIEQRTQIYQTGGTETTLVTERRFNSRPHMAARLAEAGFVEIKFTADYQINNLQPLRPEAETQTRFVVTALKS